MPIKKRLNSDGQWVDISSEILKTDISVTEAEQPSVITPGDEILLVSSKKMWQPTPYQGSYMDTGISVTIQQAGTYKFKSCAGIENGYGTSFKAKLVKNSASNILTEISIGREGGVKELIADNVVCSKGDAIKLYVQPSRYSSSGEYMGAGMQILACINGGHTKTNSVKRKKYGTWFPFDTKPLHVPIEVTEWNSKYLSTDRLGIFPIGQYYTKLGSIALPWTGSYTFTWGLNGYGGMNDRMKYQLYLNDSVIQSGQSSGKSDTPDEFTLTRNCNAGDVIRVDYQGHYNPYEGIDYFMGTGCALIAHYND